MRSKYIKNCKRIKRLPVNSIMLSAGLLLSTGFNTNCQKLVTAEAPVIGLNALNVYNSDATATAVLTGIYTKMSGALEGYTFTTGRNSISLMAGLSADEFTLYSGVSNVTYLAFYRNALSANPAAAIGANYWSELYNCIFLADSAMEGLNKTATLSPSVKQQLLGEARFLRAFCYFYLVNLFGDVPLVTATDYQVNASLPRTPKEGVYELIITDLQVAQELLSADYLDGNLHAYTTSATERVRPTRWAAAALLARAYLYKGDYANAATQATNVIDQESLFHLEELNAVFLKNSQEAIWQLQPVRIDRNTEDAFAFIIPPSGPSNASRGVPCYLSPYLLQAFEVNDQRRSNWIGEVTVGNYTYWYPYKYKLTIETPVNEYLMVMRLAELFLVRAEANARQNNLVTAVADLNIIRKRAGIANSSATTQATVLTAILHEKQLELFGEWGHRWLDLKRTGKVNEVMSLVTPQKGGAWNANWQWYPLPLADLQKNTNLTQNAGY